MRPPMTDDEITLLKADLDKLGESQLVGIEPMRRCICWRSAG